MSILVGIDGTGAEIFSGAIRDERYDTAFANSFVRKLCGQSAANKRYLRGPILLGGVLLDAISKGHNFILDRRRAGVDERIVLTGYSRGAAGVVVIATMLQRQSVDVKAMLLFGCLDRHVAINADVIPNNVGYVLHVMRSPDSGSRRSFGNAATLSNPPTLYQEAIFTCSHGGMGGVPWPVPAGQSPDDFIVEGWPDGKTNVTYAQDAWASSRVWGYVGWFVRKYGFPIPRA